MFKTFPDNRVGNRPYKTMFARGDWTCTAMSSAFSSKSARRN
jgi:hypothetical protein